MSCPTCGAAATSPTQKFCAECGAALGKACPSCAKPYEGSPKFCPECGFGLTTVAVAPAAARVALPVAAPAAAQTPGSATTAERKLVTVLFADLVGFTTMSEQNDAEAVREQLTEYFAVAEEIIARYGGTIEKFIGDAVMAVWGTPVAHEDDAERGVRAALELVDAVSRLGRGEQKLSIRAGVLSGEAAVTLGASNQGMVAGDLVNTASRLQSVAPPNTVLVGESTYHAAESAIVFEPVGEQELKGKVSPVPAYRAIRVVAKRGGAGRGEQLEAPFMGRDAEMRLIKELFHAAPREKRPRLLSIIGQAGLGKSRLAWEFNKYIDGILETVRWHQGRSPAYGEGIGFWALAEMVRSRVGLLELDDPATSRAKLNESLETFAPDEAERRWMQPKLEQLLGIGASDTGGQEELFAAWRTYFERVAGENTAVLVFEDLHWADPGLLDFIDHMLEWSRGYGIYIISLSRPELLDRRPNWGAGQRSFTSLSLEPLPDEVIGAILGSLIPGLPAPTMKQIVARAEGIPLYAVETVRMLLQEGRLELHDGVYRPIGDLSTLAVPATLQALISARLDALDGADRALLQKASVLGQTFTIKGVTAITGEAAELEPRLLTLVRKELLTLDTDPRSPERGQYGFVQALVRDVAYSTLTKRDRKVLHLAAGVHFESLLDDEIVDATASHYLDAYRSGPDDPDADQIRTHAAELLQRAAERAAGLGSHEQAVRFLELGLEITTDVEGQLPLLQRAGVAATAAGRYEIAEKYLRRSLEAAHSVGDRSSQGRALASLGFVLSSAGQPATAISTILAGLDELGEVGDDPAGVAVWAALARAYMMHADFQLSVEWADRGLPTAERLDMIPEIADLLITRATSLGSLGRVRESIAGLKGALDLAEAYGLGFAAARARTNLSGGLFLEDPRTGWETGKAGFEQAKREGRRDLMTILALNAVGNAVKIGKWDDALRIVADMEGIELDPTDRYYLQSSRLMMEALLGRPYEEGLDGLRAFASTSDEPGIVGQLASIEASLALISGAYDDAQAAALRSVSINAGAASDDLPVAARAALWAGRPEVARDAVDRLRAVGSHGRALNANLHSIEAGLAASDGRPDEAAAGYRDAMRDLRDLEAWFDLALCELDFVRFVGGESPDVEAAASEAREIFTRLGAQAFVQRLDQAVGLPVG